jgi:hypothetical protein
MREEEEEVRQSRKVVKRDKKQGEKRRQEKAREEKNTNLSI